MAVLKQRENVRALSAYMRSEVPPLYTALIAERDAYSMPCWGSNPRTRRPYLWAPK